MKEGFEISNTILTLLGFLGVAILFIWKTGQGEAKKDTKTEGKLDATTNDIKHLKKSLKKKSEQIDHIKSVIDAKYEKACSEIKLSEVALKAEIKQELQHVDKKIETTEIFLKAQLLKMEHNIEKLANQNTDVLIVLRVIENQLKEPKDKPYNT